MKSSKGRSVGEHLVTVPVEDGEEAEEGSRLEGGGSDGSSIVGQNTAAICPARVTGGSEKLRQSHV